jgi:PAS domain S-box-containing protein
MDKKEHTAIPPETLALRSCFSDLQLAQSLFDLVSDIVFFVKDNKARYVAVNESLVGRCGLKSKEQILGKTAKEVYPEPLGDLFHDQDLEVLEFGSKITGRIELHLYQDGSHGWCLTDKMPLFDQDGNVIGLAGISHDLHEPGQQRSEFGQVAQAVARIAKEYDRSLRVADLAEDC